MGVRVRVRARARARVRARARARVRVRVTSGACRGGARHTTRVASRTAGATKVSSAPVPSAEALVAFPIQPARRTRRVRTG